MSEEKITYNGKPLSLLEKTVINRLREIKSFERIEIVHKGDFIVVDHKLSIYERFPIDT